jgi:hypothetical protein
VCKESPLKYIPDEVLLELNKLFGLISREQITFYHITTDDSIPTDTRHLPILSSERKYIETTREDRECGSKIIEKKNFL